MSGQKQGRAPFCRWPLATSVLALWLTRAVLGWLVLSPLAFAVSGSGIGALPQGDRALFAPGGLWLLELARVRAELLSASLRPAAVLYAVCAVGCALPLALAFSIQARAGDLAVRRAFTLVPAFLLVGAAELAALALWLFLALLIGASAAGSIRACGVVAEDATTVGFAVVALLGVMALAVLADVVRARLAQVPRARFSLGGALDAAGRAAAALTGGYVLASGAGALLVAIIARSVELIGIEQEGPARLVAASLLHQASLLGLSAVQVLWIRRVSRAVSQQRSVHPEHADKSARTVELGDPSSYRGA